MARLIDADKLKESIDNCDICDMCSDKGIRCSFNCDFPDALDYKWEKLIDAQPTIDAVEVVRCKDCRHWHDHITTTWCSRGAELRPQESGWIKRKADDFCSYGERKDHE